MVAGRKVVLVGLDSIAPVMVDRFVAEGRMPNLQRMMQRGWSAEIVSTLPATTPAAWTTVATGAWPSTHGIEGFTVHVEGDPLDKKVFALTSDRVKAEFIWQAAARAGKRTIVMKYPVSWPPTGGDHVVQVDGAGGWGGMKCVWDLAHSACWDTAAPPAAPVAPAGVEWATRDQDNLYEELTRSLAVTAPGPWANVPPGWDPLWETTLTLRARGVDDGTVLYLLAARERERAHLVVAGSRDLRGAAGLAEGAWSDPVRVALPTADGPRAGVGRLKVMQFDAPSRRLRLYQTQVHQEAGYTHPPSVAAELLAAAGPFVEWTESYDRLQGWIDDETQLEIYEQHVEWMSRAARHLLGGHPWDLFMTQVQFIDMAYHLYWGAVDPAHPQYDPGRAPAYWTLLGRVHELADRFLGAVLEAAGPDALAIALGDHGHDVYHTNFMANHLLVKEGWLSVYRDRRTGAPRIDWPRTRAYASGYRVYLNVAGRDPQGAVSERDYAAAREGVIQSLREARDPRTGAHPVCLAIRREDAESLGLYGGSMGDVVCSAASGYQIRTGLEVAPEAWVAERVQRERIPLYRPTRLFHDFTGEHDTSFPFTRAIRSLIAIAGPGVRPGRRRVPVRMVDVAPTMCRYLEIPFPAQCEGSPIWEVLAAADPGPTASTP